MPGYSLGHLQNHLVLQGLDDLAANDRGTTAQLLAHIGEVRARRLYAEPGYSSMYDYCIKKLRFSEDMAGKRITTARVARRFPFVFDLVADARLHVSALCLLSKPLRSLHGEAARELILAAVNKTNDEIRVMLVAHSPRRDLASRVTALHDKETSESALERICPESGDSLNGVSDDSPAIPPTESAPNATVRVEESRPARTTPLPWPLRTADDDLRGDARDVGLPGRTAGTHGVAW